MQGRTPGPQKADGEVRMFAAILAAMPPALFTLAAHQDIPSWECSIRQSLRMSLGPLTAIFYYLFPTLPALVSDLSAL